MLPQIPRIPEIVVHCVCNREQFAIADPEDCPSCSCPRSRSPSPPMSSPPGSAFDLRSKQTPPFNAGLEDGQVVNPDLGSDTEGASPSTVDFPVLPSFSAMGYTPGSLPSPAESDSETATVCKHDDASTDGSQGQAQSNTGSTSGSGKTKTFIVVVPTSGEKPSASSSWKRESVALPSQPAAFLEVAVSDVTPAMLRLAPTFSTTTSLVDLLLEAIAADSDVTASSSSSSSSSSSTISRCGSRSDDSSDDEYEDDPVSEVLSLYFSAMEDSDSRGSGASDDGTSWRASRSSLTSSADLDAQVRTGWRASLGRMWAAHGVSVTVLST